MNFDISVRQPESRVDILFVDDNSGSMAEEQKKMGERFPTFIQSLQSLDWQIGIITTDATASGTDFNRGWTDGQLLQFHYADRTSSGRYVIDKFTTRNDELFRSTIQRDGPYESGSSNERGVYTAYRNIERRGQYTLYRENSHLAVVILSDEDERSTGTNLEYRDIPANYVNLVNSTWNNQKQVTVHSIITRPGDIQCKRDNGYNYGYVYAELTRLTNGVLGDICAVDYGAQLQTIGNSILDSFKNYKLKCAPYNNQVAVTITPSAPGSTMSLNQDLLTISPRLAPGTNVRMQYSCVL